MGEEANGGDDGSATVGRTVDEATLRYLSRVLGQQREVAGTSLFPANRQESLVVDLDTTYLPEAIGRAWLELRAYTNGEFHVTYAERYLGERRECRWDRHDQPHNSRDHFHPLPDAGTDAAEDRTFPGDLTVVVRETVLPWVQERVGELWDGAGGEGP